MGTVLKRIGKNGKELISDIIALIIALYIGLAPITISLTAIVVAGLVF